MDATAIREFLDGHRHATVATTRPNGRPQASPLSFVVHEASFWFAISEGQRLRNLEHVPYLALVISDDGDAGHRLFIAEGPTTLHPVTADAARAWADRHGREPSWASALIEVAPERLFTYGGE